jgi:hypothetical protein
MTDAGYAVYAKCVNTVFFRAEDQKWKTAPPISAP